VESNAATVRKLVGGDIAGGVVTIAINTTVEVQHGLPTKRICLSNYVARF